MAGINAFWRVSEYSIRHSVRNAIQLANQHKFVAIAFPIIGSGSGGFSKSKALEMMLDELSGITTDLQVKIVEYKR